MYIFNIEEDIPLDTCKPNLRLYWAASGKRINRPPTVGCEITKMCKYYMKDGCFLKDKIKEEE